MPLKAPRLHLRTLLALVALAALLLWAGAWVWSPLHRLSARLGPETPAYLRREAAFGLGYGIPPWETERAISVLIRTLGDPSPRVRESAAGGLAAHGADAVAAIPHLLKLVDDEDRGARATALGALGVIVEKGQVANPEVMGALIDALDDGDMDVRLMSADALAKLGNVRPIAAALVSAVATPGYEGRARAILRRVGASTDLLIPEIAELAADPDPGRREAALKLLIDHGGQDAVESALRRALRDRDESVRRWAASTMGRLGLAASP